MRHCDYDVIQEALSIDLQMVFRIYQYFNQNDEDRDIKDIEGMTDELIEKINSCSRI